MSVFAELKRRNVYKIATAYVVGSWLLLQIASVLFPAFEMPVSAMRILAVSLLFLFPIVLTITWAFELTPSGIQRTSETEKSTADHKLNMKFTIALLTTVVVTVGVLLAIPTTRSWLVETVVSAVMASASALSSTQLEVQLGIAVLPFVNMSSDADNEYFSDGISEEILNALVQTNRLPVIARTSSFQFKGQNRDIKEIGRLLGVTHVLEGSVRKSNNQVRITAQLIDTATGAHLWSETYDRELRDIFILQDEIAGMIVEQIGNTLSGEERERYFVELPGAGLQRRGTTNPEAHEAMLRGLQLAAIDNPFKIEESLVYFDRAIELDDSYADAWAMRGSVLMYLAGGSYGLYVPADVHPQAMAAFRQALELDPNHAFSMGWLGYTMMMQDYQWHEGSQLMKRSLELAPNNASMLAIYGLYLLNIRSEDAKEIMDQAYRLNPLSPVVIITRATSLFAQGKGLDATALVNTGLLNAPLGYSANYWASIFNIFVGRVDEADMYLKRAEKVVGEDYPSLVWVRNIITIARGVDEQHRLRLEEKLLTLAETRSVPLLLAIGGQLEYSERVWRMAIDQRQHAVFDYVFKAKPARMSDVQWQRIQEITNAHEVTRGAATSQYERSQGEQDALLARAIELSPEELDSFAGFYELSLGSRTEKISRLGGHLQSDSGWIAVAIEPTQFAALNQKAEIEFILQDGKVTGYIAHFGQLEIRAERVVSP